MASRRTAIGIVAVGAVAAVALTACSGTASGGDAGNTIDGTPKGDIKVITWRTDLITDGTFDKYAKAFEKKYPDVKVTFEGITDYEGEMKTRLSTSSYGDVIGIPQMTASQFSQFLEPLGKTSDLSATYRFTSLATYDGTQYGVSSGGNANGVIYNKKVWQDAGITDLPKTEDEFLADLKKIKDGTKAIPLYTNYKDGWPLTQAMGSLGAITNDPDAAIHMAKDKAPWTKGTEIYALDSVWYDAVHAKLTEADPLTTNWEQSKADFGSGKIGTMILGSWAISQMQAAAKTAGASADDIGYMAWPSNISGKQYAMIGGDYNLGISKHSKAKAAAWAWIQWFVKDSGFTETQGEISPLVSKELPANLAGLTDAKVTLLEANPAPKGEESLLNDVANGAKIDLYGPLYRQKLIDVARGAADGDKSSYFAQLNQEWAASVEKNVK